MNKKIGQGLVLMGMLCILWMGVGKEKSSEKKEEDYEEVFQLLNKNLLDLEYEGARDMVIPVVNKESMFPPELVLKMEQGIYRSLNEYVSKYHLEGVMDENNPYEELKKELGGESMN